MHVGQLETIAKSSSNRVIPIEMTGVYRWKFTEQR